MAGCGQEEVGVCWVCWGGDAAFAFFFFFFVFFGGRIVIVVDAEADVMGFGEGFDKVLAAGPELLEFGFYGFVLEGAVFVGYRLGLGG